MNKLKGVQELKIKTAIIVDEQECWQCSACNQILLPSSFSRDGSRRNGLSSQCTKCRLLRRNKDAKRESNRLFMARARKKDPEKFRERARLRLLNPDYKARHSQKIKARAMLNHAVRDGKVMKPQTCFECSQVTPLQAHHHDYAKPLDVVWLCSLCHGKKHRDD